MGFEQFFVEGILGEPDNAMRGAPVLYGRFGNSLRDLPRACYSNRKRVSSWDRSEGNEDRPTVTPGTAVTPAEIEDRGSIAHIWCTAGQPVMAPPDDTEPDFLRKPELKITWNGQPRPGVLASLGDFFGAGHERTVNFQLRPAANESPGQQGFHILVPHAVLGSGEGRAGQRARLVHAGWHRENATDGALGRATK